MLIPAPELAEGAKIALDAFILRASRYRNNELNPLSEKAEGSTKPSIGRPLPVYVLRRADALKDPFEMNLPPTEWQYPIEYDGQVRTVHVRDGENNAKFAAVMEGELTQRVEEAVAFACKKFERSAETYEMRLLKIPATQVLALWLKGHHGQEDLFATIPTRPCGTLKFNNKLEAVAPKEYPC